MNLKVIFANIISVVLLLIFGQIVFELIEKLPFKTIYNSTNQISSVMSFNQFMEKPFTILNSNGIEIDNLKFRNIIFISFFANFIAAALAYGIGSKVFKKFNMKPNYVFVILIIVSLGALVFYGDIQNASELDSAYDFASWAFLAGSLFVILRWEKRDQKEQLNITKVKDNDN